MVHAILGSRNLSQRIALTYVVLVSFSIGRAQSAAQDPAALEQRMEHAAALTSLDLPGTRPWHLKLSLVTTDAKLPAVQEAVEEWWTAPDRWRVDYTNAAGAVTSEIHSSEGQFRTQSAPRVSGRDRLLLHEVVHPLPQQLDLEKVQLMSRTATLRGRNFDCIAVSARLPSKPGIFGPETRYCFDPGKDLLRITYPTPFRIIARVTLGKFQDRDIPMELQDRNAAERLTTVKLLELKSEVADPAKFVPDSSMANVPERVSMSGGVLAGRRISGKLPAYPQAAKRDHISGQVILSAVIGKDGHVTDLEAESSPSSILTQAAIDAVKTWTYEPYLLGGSPVEVETTITVNFNIG